MNKMSKKMEYALMALKYMSAKARGASLSNSDKELRFFEEKQGSSFYSHVGSFNYSADNLSTAKEISEQMHIPFDVTARVLQALSSRGLLQAEYGVGGGYKITRELQSLSIHDLNEMLEGHVALTKCLSAEDTCDIASTCNITSPINELNKRVQDFYKSVSVQEVLNV